MGRICVIGVGAVGSLVAGRLAQAGEDVTLIARGTRKAQLEREGLRIAREDKPPLRFDLPVREIEDAGEHDLIFLAVKSQALPAILPHAYERMGKRAVVVPLVNGLPYWYLARREAASQWPLERTVGAVVYMTAYQDGEGVAHAKGAVKLELGDADGVRRPRTEEIADRLQAAGLGGEVCHPIGGCLWTKLALNMATNPLSVVSRATLVEQFTDPDLLPIASEILEEVCGLSRAEGYCTRMSLEEMVETGRRAGRFETSMLQDFRAGRPLELSTIGRAVLDLGQRHGLDMPASRAIVNLADFLSQQQAKANA